MNKKGNLTLVEITLTAGAIAFILLLLFLVAFVGYGYYKYDQQNSEGENVLKDLSISTIYENPVKGSTEGIIFAVINGSKINGKVAVTTTYLAYNFDRSKTINLKSQDNSYLSLEMPFPLSQEMIDTSSLYTQLGNEAEACISVDITYKEINWMGFILGYPSKRLEDCRPFLGNFENK